VKLSGQFHVPTAFSPRKLPPVLIVYEVGGPGAGLDAVEKKQISLSCQK
jgi:hypothetical protein